MLRKECIAMILAGGKGERLGTLTDRVAKPIVYFGGKYRIIDFSLSNCTHSGIDTLGVLTQYKAQEISDYIGDGQAWDFSRQQCGGVYMLPSMRAGGPYIGTANAILQNIDFIDRFHPEHVLVLSGDHIYKMDYGKMLDFHKKKDAAVTISVIDVPHEEASRFGIMSTNQDGRITVFEEKPRMPKSTLASMGIYLFKWNRLKEYLLADQKDEESTHDFGKNIIPAALANRELMYAYRFDGYWRDVGTVQSLWESNMDLLKDAPPIDLYNNRWRIQTQAQYHAPCYLSSRAEVKRSIIAEGCHVFGELSNSILCDSVTVEEDAEVIDSVLMPGAVIGKGARIMKTIVGDGAYVGANAEIGAEEGIRAYLDDRICSKGISVIGSGICIEGDTKIIRNSHVHICPRGFSKGSEHTVYPREAIPMERVYA